MLNFLDLKTKATLGTILVITSAIYVIDKVCNYKTYQLVKNIDKRLKKNSWEYYD